MLIYLDNAATTKPKYLDVVDFHQKHGWFNPSAAYNDAAKVLADMKDVRNKLLDNIGLNGNVVFTSGGTEANNLVVQSAFKKHAHYITSAVEHPSIYAVFKQMEQNGADVDYVKPNGLCVGTEAVAALVRDDTALVSIMHVNNETGAINDIEGIAAAVKAKNPTCVFHSDGVQALKKTQVNLAGSEVDYYTVSAHKINALKGTGALIIRNGKRIKPIIYGGGQESTFRPGTENTLGIQVFGAALEDKDSGIEKIEKLRERLVNGLGQIKNSVINVPKAFVPHIVSVSFEGLRAEVLVRLLGDRGVYIGTGAACSKGKVSRVLLESGIDRKLAEGTVRISMSKENTEQEIDSCINEIKIAVEELRRFNRN